MKKKVIATIVVAVIAISGITVAFAANNDGLVGPKDILPGTITSGDIKDNDIKACDIGGGEVNTSEIAADAVTSNEIEDGTITSDDIGSGAVYSGDIQNGEVASDDIKDKTIDDVDLGDTAIPSVVLNNTSDKRGLGNTWSEEFNASISTDRRMAFIFTYAADLTDITPGNALVAQACIIKSDKSDQYLAEPSSVRVADDNTARIQRIVTFTNSSVSAGNYFVTASVKTNKSGTADITDRVFTVIALPT